MHPTKNEIRKIARKARAYSQSPEKSTVICQKFLTEIALKPDDVIASYQPMGSEVEIEELNKTLSKKYNFCLPCITSPDAPLIFRKWVAGEALIEGKYSIFEPSSKSVILNPDIIIVPLLAFDENKNRLGYGGGYYDRTLALYTNAKKIGLAYEAQKFEYIPSGKYDIKLDTIITEEKIH
jgi:5-formyltetrahydrofolate cyclo-ligase